MECSINRQAFFVQNYRYIILFYKTSVVVGLPFCPYLRVYRSVGLIVLEFYFAIVYADIDAS